MLTGSRGYQPWPVDHTMTAYAEPEVSLSSKTRAVCVNSHSYKILKTLITRLESGSGEILLSRAWDLSRLLIFLKETR